jgi:hypothetical protein
LEIEEEEEEEYFACEVFGRAMIIIIMQLKTMKKVEYP